MNYLYNGAELPARPQRDETLYPNELISYDLDTGVYTLVQYSGAVVKVDSSWSAHPDRWTSEEEDVRHLWQDLDGDSWSDAEPSLWLLTGGIYGKIIWSAQDIYNRTDGTLYLAASDPVPVGPVTAQNSAAMLMGFQLGTAIRRMRGK